MSKAFMKAKQAPKKLPKIEFEAVDCLLCGPGPKERVVSAPDRYNNLPGEFHVSRCRQCGLAFQDPRPKEAYIHLFYPETMGYFTPQERINSKLSQDLHQAILINFYDYTNQGPRNFPLKL